LSTRRPTTTGLPAGPHRLDHERTSNLDRSPRREETILPNRRPKARPLSRTKKRPGRMRCKPSSVPSPRRARQRRR